MILHEQRTRRAKIVDENLRTESEEFTAALHHHTDREGSESNDLSGAGAHRHAQRAAEPERADGRQTFHPPDTQNLTVSTVTDW